MNSIISSCIFPKYHTFSPKLCCFHHVTLFVFFFMEVFWQILTYQNAAAYKFHMILFQASASHSSFCSDQLNLAFKLILVNVGFFIIMQLFISYSQRMHFVVSSDTKLDKLHLSVTCLAVFFNWAFTLLISFCAILSCSVWRKPHLGQSKTLPVSWNWEEFLWYLFLNFWVS